MEDDIWHHNWTSLQEKLTQSYQKTYTSCSDFVELLQLLDKISDPLARKWNKTLPEFFEKGPQNFFIEILPFIIKLALKWPDIKPQMPSVLRAGTSGTIKLSRQMVAIILSHLFLGLFKIELVNDRENLTPIDIRLLYSNISQPQEAAKLYCIINYFNRIRQGLPAGEIELSRRCLPKDKIPNWETSNKPLRKWDIRKEGSISDAENCLHVDFANRCLGGGVICGGCVQEEILFALNTELIAFCLFSQPMKDNEAIIMRGSYPYSKHSGYAFSLTYAGDYTEEQKPTTIIAIDAIDYRFYNPANQYENDYFNRELLKAYVGFSQSTTHLDENSKAIATGKWGCGAFLGNVAFKSILQYIASSEAEKDLVFYTFNDPLTADMEKISNLLSTGNWKVSDLYKILKQFNPALYLNAFQYLNDRLKPKE